MSSPIRAVDHHHSEHRILPPKLDVSVGPRSHLFQPPRAPSASSSLILHSSASLASPRPSSRKRPWRGEASYADPIDLSNRSSARAWSVARRPLTSPASLADTGHRRPGGGHDHDDSRFHHADADVGPPPTKRRSNAREEEDEDDYDDYGYLSYSPVPAKRRGGDGVSHGVVVVADETAPAPPPPATTPASSGWGRVVFDVVGDVAGRVWHFCTAGAFRGFYAGGGRGYDMSDPATTTTTTASPPPPDAQKTVGGHGRPSTPVLGPTVDRQLDDSREPVLNSPPAKRIQRDQGTGELRDHWVIVSPRKTPTRQGEPPPSLSSSIGGGPGPREARTPTSRTTTTTATSRIGRRHRHRPGFSPGRLPSPTMAGHCSSTSPTRHQARSSAASYASPRGPLSPSKKNDDDDDVLSPETRRLMAQHHRRERAKEASMQRFDRQLKTLLREGKQALDTIYRIEDVDVVDDDDSPHHQADHDHDDDDDDDDDAINHDGPEE